VLGTTNQRLRNHEREHVLSGSMDISAFPLLEANARCDNSLVMLRSEGALRHHYIPVLYLPLSTETLDAEC